ncbi:hypothetical protein D9M69_397360 [compost metagenome]
MRLSALATRLSKAFSILSSCTSTFSFTPVTLLFTLSNWLLAASTCSSTSFLPCFSTPSPAFTSSLK